MPPPLNEPHERLAYARSQRGFKTASDFARRYNFNENTYRSHENGERGLRPKTAEEYAEKLDVSASWLLYSEGEMTSREISPEEMQFILRYRAADQKDRDIIERLLRD